MAEETAEQKLKRYEYVLDAQANEIDKLRAEVERLTATAGAHETLKSIYLDRDLPESLRAKAAIGALPFERPKMGSILPSGQQVSRFERWRLYERWAQRREYIIEHKDIPPKGWDAHLQPDTFQEPEGTDLPPVEIVPDSSSPWGHRILTNLLPKPGTGHRNGNGSGD